MGSTRPSGQGCQDLLELAAIVETLSEPVLGKTLDGTIRSWNAGAEPLYGYSADEILGKRINILVPPERHAEIDEILARVRRREVITLETVRAMAGRNRVQVSISVMPARSLSGEILGASTVAHDISDRKRCEGIQSFVTGGSRLLALNIEHRWSRWSFDGAPSRWRCGHDRIS